MNYELHFSWVKCHFCGSKKNSHLVVKGLDKMDTYIYPFRPFLYDDTQTIPISHSETVVLLPAKLLLEQI